MRQSNVISSALLILCSKFRLYNSSMLTTLSTREDQYPFTRFR